MQGKGPEGSVFICSEKCKRAKKCMYVDVNSVLDIKISILLNLHVVYSAVETLYF